ncbi:MAG: DNA-processing protein DprA [Deltaproteobacteria bacterium]|jgi:DNA processing protein|nr:DNA-processing protein DprA [Deltaproteobacteria bacterium]
MTRTASRSPSNRPRLSDPPTQVAIPGLPAPLYLLGTLPEARVAVVGARASDPYGLAVTRRVARDLAEQGWTVVSGGAEGCDREAHEGAMEGGGRTVVVLPAGHDHYYPRHHAGLFQRVLDGGGAIVSEHPLGVPISRHRFLARNRVIALLSRGVLVARAREHSGSLSTARAASELGRPVAAVPGAVGEALSEGCHLLLDEGAVPIVSPLSFGQWLGEGARKAGRRSQWSRWPCASKGQPAPWDTRKGRAADVGQGELGLESATRGVHVAPVLEALAQEPGLDLDAIAVRTGIPFADLVTVALGLELEGRIERWPGGRYAVPVGQGEGSCGEITGRGREPFEGEDDREVPR